MPANRFVIVSSQRSGSTLLVKSLDSAPEIFCAGELFHFGERTLHREYRFPYLRSSKSPLAKIVAKLLQSGRVERHLEHFYQSAGAGVRAAGFKLMVSQADRFRSILGWLERRQVKVICLYRRNTFEAALSYCLAAQTGRFHSDRTPGTSEPMELTVDARKFETFFLSCAKDRVRVESVHRSLGGLLVAYEDLSADWGRWVSGIGEYIGVAGLKVPMSLEKLAGGNKARVANESELRRLFAGPGGVA